MHSSALQWLTDRERFSSISEILEGGSPADPVLHHSLLTGLYPWRLGMQRGAIERYQPDGLNASIRILPQYLQEAGYATHAVMSSSPFSLLITNLLRLGNGTLVRRSE